VEHPLAAVVPFVEPRGNDMPLYYFNVDDGQSLPERIETEFLDDEAVRQEAVSVAGEFLTELDGDIWKREGNFWNMTVTDSGGNTICSFHFRANGPAD
jgi:hypothetical protein